MQTFQLSSLGSNEDIWNLYRTDELYVHEGKMVTNMKRYCFEMKQDGRTATLGLYEYSGVEIFKAWGYKDEEHCSYHAIKTNGV